MPNNMQRKRFSYHVCHPLASVPVRKCVHIVRGPSRQRLSGEDRNNRRNPNRLGTLLHIGNRNESARLGMLLCPADEKKPTRRDPCGTIGRRPVCETSADEESSNGLPFNPPCRLRWPWPWPRPGSGGSAAPPRGRRCSAAHCGPASVTFCGSRCGALSSAGACALRAPAVVSGAPRCCCGRGP